MANATVTVLEADGVTQTDVVVLDVGRQAAAASKSVAASTEDKAVLDAIAASLALLDNSISAGNEIQVDVVAALPAGTNNIGDVDVLTVSGQTLAFGTGAASASTLRVVIADDSQNANGRAAAADSGPVVLANEDKTALVDDAAFTPATSNVNVAGYFADEASTDSIDEGDAGAARMTLDRKQIVTMQPHTAGGFAAPFVSLDLDETEELVKTGAGCLYKIRCTNRTTSIRYVKLYDGVLAGVTVGTTTPIDVIPVPAGASADLATVLTESFGGLGLPFTTGLCLACTTGFADADTGAPGANDVIVSAYYK